MAEDDFTPPSPDERVDEFQPPPIESRVQEPPPEQPQGYVGRGEFAPSAGAESVPLTSRETPEEQAAQQGPLANAAAVTTELIGGIPQMALGVAKAGYEGAKFAAFPQERPRIAAEALKQGVDMGVQTAQDVQAPLGTKESFRGLAGVGMMALAPLQEILFGGGMQAPPVQDRVGATTAPTLTETLFPTKVDPLVPLTESVVKPVRATPETPPIVAETLPTGTGEAPTQRLPYSASDAEKDAWRQAHGNYKFDELSPEAQTKILSSDLGEIPESKRAEELQYYSFNKNGDAAPTIIRRQGDSLIATPVTKAEGATTAATLPIKQGEITNAIEPSNAQVEAGKTQIGVGGESEIAAAGSSDNVVREAQGAAARGQIPARQGTEAQPPQAEVAAPEINPRFQIVGSRGRGEGTHTSDYDLVTKLTPEEHSAWVNTPEGEYPVIPQEIKDAANAGHDVFIETKGQAWKVEPHPVSDDPNHVVVERVSQIEKNLLAGKRRPEAATTAAPLTQTERSISVNKTPVAQTTEAGTGGVPWETTGADLGTVYHGGKKSVKTPTIEQAQQRDYGFYGKGFYVTSAEHYAKTYGNRISQFQFDPNAKILKSELLPENAPKGLVDEVVNWVHDQGIEAVKKRGKEAGFADELASIRTSPIEWKNAVDRYGEAHGYDAIIHSNGEIVVKNPSALRKPPSVSVEGQAPTASVKPKTGATSQEIPTGSGIQKEEEVPNGMINAVRTPDGKIVGHGIEHGDVISGLSERYDPSQLESGWVIPKSTRSATDSTFIGTEDVQKTNGDFAAAFKEKGVDDLTPAKQTVKSIASPLPKETSPVSTTPETPPISTKNAYTEAQRAVRGLPEAEQAAKRGFGKVWDEAAAQAEKDPTIGRRLVAEINAKPRPISDVENAHLLRREIEAQKEHSDAVDAVNSATTDSDLTAAKARLESARNDLQDVYDATKSAGTKGGQALAARQMLAKEDYSLAKMEARRRAANDGQPLNEQQLAETKALNEKITDLQSKLDAHEVAATFDREFSKLVDQSRKEAKVSKATGTRFTDFMDRKADEARARITERRGRLTTGFDPTSITDEAVIGASHIAKGITKFADWSVEMAKEFGDQIRPFLKDLWERSKAFHDANASAYGDKALARYKTYLGKQTEQIKGKLEAGDFTKAQRQKTQLDKEAFNMRADLQKLKNQFERGVAKEAYQNKSPAQKFWDHFVGVERAMKLSGPEVFGKLGVAAAVREGLAPIESGVGFGVSKVFPKLAKGTKYEADLGTLVRGELKAKAALFTEGMKDAWQNVKGQETGLDAIGKQKIRPDFWYNRIGQMHAAIKAPVKRAEFTRDLEQRMSVAIKNGEDINHPEVMTRIANESVMEANRAIFQNNTVVSRFFSMLERQNPIAGRVARFLQPVVKIPVNLFKEFVNLHVGAPVGATKIGMAYWKGVETLPPVQREAIIRQLTKGSIGGAALLWGYYNRDKVRNFFDHVPTWFNHTPIAMVLNEGSYLPGLTQGGEEAKKSKKELAYMAKTDIPFMYTIKDIGDALDTHDSHALLDWINNMTQSTVVPQISTQVAKQMDKPGTFPSNLGEKPTYRPAANPVEAVKLGIPGLRQTVPVKPPRKVGTGRKNEYGF